MTTISLKFLVPTNFKIVPTGLQTTTEALCTRPRVICVLQCKKSSVKVAKCAICKTSIVIHTHTSMYLNGSHLPKSRIKRRYSCINTQFNVSSLSALAQGRRNRGRGQVGGGRQLPPIPDFDRNRRKKNLLENSYLTPRFSDLPTALWLACLAALMTPIKSFINLPIIQYVIRTSQEVLHIFLDRGRFNYSNCCE